MSLSIGKAKLMSRLGSSAASTILFAGNWCILANKEDLQYLNVTVLSWGCDVAVIAGLGLVLLLILMLADCRNERVADRLSVFFLLASLINLLDYFMRSIFGKAGSWGMPLVISWMSFTGFYLLGCAIYAWKGSVNASMPNTLLKVFSVPCLLLLCYAYPEYFVKVKIHKPKQAGHNIPIHILLFDMMPYDLLCPGGIVPKEFPHFSYFSSHSEVYADCQAPGESTWVVIPQIFSGRTIAQMKAGWDETNRGPFNRFVAARKGENIFSMMDSKNYNIFVLAFAVNYIEHFGKSIQWGKIYRYDRHMGCSMHAGLATLLFPGGKAHQKTARDIERDYIAAIKKGTTNRLFYVHWNLPHFPFAYDENGRELSRFALIKNFASGESPKSMALGQIKAADALFGKAMEALKEEGSYDQSLIIVLADTNMPGVGREQTHVPLIVKYPGQKTGRIVDRPVSTLNFLDFLKSFLEKSDQAQWPSTVSRAYS